MSISAAVATLRPTIERLAEFAALGPDWDSYGGLPTSPRAVSAATELLILVADRLAHRDPPSILPYAVAPIADGGVQVEWRGPRHEIEVEIGSGGGVGYLLIEQQGQDRRFDERSDVSMQRLLDLVAMTLEP